MKSFAQTNVKAPLGSRLKQKMGFGRFLGKKGKNRKPAAVTKTRVEGWNSIPSKTESTTSSKNHDMDAADEVDKDLQCSELVQVSTQLGFSESSENSRGDAIQPHSADYDLPQSPNSSVQDLPEMNLDWATDLPRAADTDSEDEDSVTSLEVLWQHIVAPFQSKKGEDMEGKDIVVNPEMGGHEQSNSIILKMMDGSLCCTSSQHVPSTPFGSLSP